MKLFASELALMELLWAAEPVSAKELTILAGARMGWNKNTTYTVLKKLVEKEAVERRDPGFVCTSRISREEVRREETDSLINRLFDGSRKAFFAAFLEQEQLTPEELAELRAMIDEK